MIRKNGKCVQAWLGDTMPSESNLANAARIDLNPGALKAYGIRPPYLGGQWYFAWGEL